jgi:hypothetical protein
MQHEALAPTISASTPTVRHFIERWALAVRALFDRVAAKTSPVFVVAVLAAAAVGVSIFLSRALAGGCQELAVSLVRLEVTFDASRFATLFRAAGSRQCQANVVDHFIGWDLLFPVCYSAALAALYIWVERWHRYTATGNPTGAPLDVVAHAVVLAPFVAGGLDILLENIPLWIAAKTVYSTPGVPVPAGIAAPVLIGSVAALVKWVLLVAVGVAILAELVRGPRGAVIRRTRYSVLAVALGALPLLAIPQGQDILQRLVEGTHPGLRVAMSVLALAGVALAVWYCGRKLVQLRFRRDTEWTTNDWYAHFAEHIPRLLGIVLLAVCGAAFAQAGLSLGAFASAAVGGFLAAFLAARLAPSERVLAALGRMLSLPYWRAVPGFTRRIGMAALAVAISAAPVVPCWLRALSGGRPDQARSDACHLRFAAWLCVLAAWVFYLFVYFRRARMVAWRARKGGPPPERDAGQRGALQPEAHRNSALESLDAERVSRQLKVGFATALAASLLVLLLFTAAPVPVARAIGPLWVLALATANAVFFGSVTVWVYGRYRIPVVSLALLLAALFSLWNDNHVVRTVERTSAADVARRTSLHAHLQQWLAFRNVDTATSGAIQAAAAGPTAAAPAVAPVRDSGTGFPIVLVATAGGGLRAAYWTATALAALQDRDSLFVRHVFAISGVSGGSLGAAVFAALARDAGADVRGLPCAAGPGEGRDTMPPPNPWSACVRRFMGDDFLSPVLAKLVAPDFAQRFTPFPIPALDRSTALEQSWESSYEMATGRPTLSHGLIALTADSAVRLRVPALFLNSTNVESGRRYIAMPLRASAAPAPAGSTAPTFADGGDVLGIVGADLPLSTAVHNSARFTYVSPAGRLERGDGIEYGRVVDGGYFENSGLATLGEIHQVVRTVRGRPGGPTLRPIVLYLCNDPTSCARDIADDTLMAMRSTGINELLAPVRAILRARDARARLARAQMRQDAGVDFLQLNVCDRLSPQEAAGHDTSSTAVDRDRVQRSRERVVSPPLGWLLSRLARDWMDASLRVPTSTEGATACVKNNADVLARLDTILRPR